MVIEQDACYVEKPKPSRAIRFDYMTFYGMSYLTAGNEWDSNNDSECKSDQMCPGMDEAKRLTNCVACSYKIGHRFLNRFKEKSQLSVQEPLFVEPI